ncbi:MAG TPA: urease accessory protein UreD [Candidatus Saccharimonadales bacterium]|nr:urease accessory protein UreD [Candidatus Saccharimonadales bacterium]
MVAPVKFISKEQGGAALEVESVFGESTVTSALARSPLKLLTPRARGRSVWACTSSFGGGLVAGDQTRLDLRLNKNTRCFLGTQASTKIYRNPSHRPCGHVTHATLAENSLLVFAPDPVQAFAGSSYSQRQEFHLAENAGLVLLDWFTSGRAARGERWEFSRFKSRNDVFAAGERIFLDSIALDSADGSLPSPMRAGRFNCFAVLLLVGEPLQVAANQLLERMSEKPVERKSPLVASASPIRNGAVLRVAGEQVEAVGREFHHHLDFLTEILGDDPWARKW